METTNLARMKPLHALLMAVLVIAGCAKRETRVEQGTREGILHVANGTEIEDIDPQIVTGVPEHQVISALTEGLVAEDPVDLHPVPGTAERWETSEDLTVWTFHLRDNATWTNGDKVTAQDFVRSYKRILTPTLAAKYAYMLFVMINAEEYQNGTLTDFDQVGVKALDNHTLRITLNSPTPYFLSLLNHYTWFPVHVPTIEKHGRIDMKGNRWTRPENFVSNGPYRLKSWRLGDALVVEKNPDYWDAGAVKLKEIRFYPIESAETQERLFRAGQLHTTYEMLPSKIEVYQKEQPELLYLHPYLSSYFYRVNTTKAPTDNKLVRKALAMAIDREAIVKNVMRGGQMPATFYTPPNTAGYTTRARCEENLSKAKEILAQAGYPGGKGMPKIEILFNTLETHRAVAEAIQEMWRKNLNIEVELVNQEWKVYLDNQRQLNYDVSRAGWTGDYVDPNTFLDMFTSWSQQNQTGWSDDQYDEFIRQAGRAADPAQRLEYFQQAEEILMDELPILPIFIYTRPYLKHPAIKNWHPTILDHHPWKHVYLEAPTHSSGS